LALQLPTERWSGKIREIIIGAMKDEGGTREKKIVVGGSATLAFLDLDGPIVHPIIIGMEVVDYLAPDFPKLVSAHFEGILDNPAARAKKCVDEYKADFICLKLESTNPEGQNKSPDEAAQTVKEVLSTVSVPLFIYGCGNEEKDSKVMEAVSYAAKGERCFLGLAENDRYKSISVASMANGHGIVAFSNLDINLAKQLNILLTDFGVKPENIIMDPLMAGIGYGVEYSYSVIERIKLAALMGDNMLQMPIICDSSIAWKAREAQIDDTQLGDVSKRGPFWEATTALAALTAGADLLIMRHPKAASLVRNTVQSLSKGGE